MNRAERIKEIITTSLTPTHLEIEDQSESHKGHRGTHDNGETHYQITISTPFFNGKTRVECHRKINTLLKDEFQTGLHALSIKII